MRVSNRLLSIASNVAIVIGVALGVSGVVRGGSIFIAVGTAGIAFTARHLRRFDFYFPLVIAIALFALAVALPRGR